MWKDPNVTQGFLQPDTRECSKQQVILPTHQLLIFSSVKVGAYVLGQENE